MEADRMASVAAHVEDTPREFGSDQTAFSVGCVAIVDPRLQDRPVLVTSSFELP